MSLRDMLRVLVVDDMSTSRGILLQALDTLGIGNVAYAENGKAAIAHVTRMPVHLIISDLYMPELNGLQLLQRIKSEPATSKIGFVLISGRSDETVLQTGRKLGMNNFLTKPFAVNQLRDCIEAVVGRL